MNCEQANQIDLVDYLHFLGHEPSKIRGNDYWYQSPLRDEKEPSFKVNRSKNVWYDHSLGKGGKLVDFTIELYHSNVSEALQKISFFTSKRVFKIWLQDRRFTVIKMHYLTRGMTEKRS